ncbi:LuxS/MPP-like metallohydrolase [Piedraia hortae CBS 480.64]|uniref:Cytochrome b-c1 complex subunit 2, mitochondrial n=1 Tax=Piedraia hortae CBS 480.64 TaxID=1314780 RepID=A0A6A7BQP0_9PEZI|nr:LuxS/MPP-like metallohydrolase [Piedraia hortae CBS 480.64]
MLSRSAIGRSAKQCRFQQNRGLAEPASGSFQYQTGDAAGVKFASRDIPGPVSTIGLVSQAGTRYQPLPGLTEGLRWYAFKNTQRRSSLRIQRESELMGGMLGAYYDRENFVLGARFLRADLPYYLELLAEVATMTKYQNHVVNEEVLPLIKMDQQKYLSNTLEMAVNSAHGVAFHRGLGVPVKPSSSMPVKQYVTAGDIAEFAASAYAKPSFAIVGNGVEHGELEKRVKEFFPNVRAQAAYPLKSDQSKYYGGEERIAHASGNSMVLGFSGSSSPTGPFYKPAVAVLAEILGGQSNIKWNPGFSLLSQAAEGKPTLHVKTRSNIYSDAGLLTVELSGAAKDVAEVAHKAVEALKGLTQNIDKELFQKAKAAAKFRELENGQSTKAAMVLTGAGLVHGGKAYQIDEVAKNTDSVTVEQVQKVAKEALENKASVSAVGDLFVLPYAEEIGLRV